jgi:hypothetical protein
MPLWCKMLLRVSEMQVRRLRRRAGEMPCDGARHGETPMLGPVPTSSLPKIYAKVKRCRCCWGSRGGAEATHDTSLHSKAEIAVAVKVGQWPPGGFSLDGDPTGLMMETDLRQEVLTAGMYIGRSWGTAGSMQCGMAQWNVIAGGYLKHTMIRLSR